MPRTPSLLRPTAARVLCSLAHLPRLPALRLPCLLPGRPSLVGPSVLVAFLLFAALAVPPAASANGILIEPEAGVPVPGHGRRPIRRHVPPVVRLEGHRVKADLKDGIASVTVEQVFHNYGPRQLEGTYLFPLPEGALVSKFAMSMGGKMVQGEIMERDQARRVYQRIVSRRRDPGLLEYMGRGLFRARVFPIPPRSDLTIRLRYQQVLPETDGTIEFRYPLASDRFGSHAVQNVSVDVRVESSVDIKTLYSPSHHMEIKRDGERRARLSYESHGERQQHDLLFYVGRSPEAVGFSLQSHKEPGRDGTFMAVFAPRTRVAPEDRVPKDVVYVLDKSGSMAGKKMEQAINAISYGVRLLREGDRFNVIAFSSNLYPFRERLVDATGEMKEAAAKYVAGLEPSGGTNIDGALKEALRMRRDGRLFMVVFITDGKPTVEVIDPKQIVANVKAANSAHTRIFTFGVGTDLDVRLLDRIAEATHGSRDYVMPDEDLEVVTGRFFRKVNQPVLTDVRIDFGSGVTDVYPRRIPELFAGGQVVVFGRYKEAGKRLLILRGHIGDREVVYEHGARFSNRADADYLPRLWASRKVGYLLDEVRLHGQNKELVDEVVQLATRYAIVTPYTAGLVVEESELEGRRLDGVTLRDHRRGRIVLPLPGRKSVPFWQDDAAPSTAGGASGKHGGRGGGGGPPAPRAPGSSAQPAADGYGDKGRERPAGEVSDSETLKKMKEGLGGGSAGAKRERDGLDAVRALVKTVAGKTFLKGRDGRWIDKAWDRKRPTTKIQAFSEAYFKLLERGDEVARFLALGERVVFVLEDTVYEIVPEAEAGK